MNLFKIFHSRKIKIIKKWKTEKTSKHKKPLQKNVYVWFVGDEKEQGSKDSSIEYKRNNSSEYFHPRSHVLIEKFLN